MSPRFDLAVTGGLLVDPAHGVERPADLGIADGRIVEVAAPGGLFGGAQGEPSGGAREVLDARGLIVAPGFIDLHSHAQTVRGHELQAVDGVTTSLELESGATPIARSAGEAVAEGRPLNFGYSAGWLLARAAVLMGLSAAQPRALPSVPLDAFSAIQGMAGWQRRAAPDEISRIVGLLGEQLDAGAIGVGMLLGYAPGTGSDEVEAVARLVAGRGLPLFVHSRFGDTAPGGPTSALDELLDLSRRFGVQIHVCHLASTYSGGLDPVAAALESASAEGLPVSIESYPFGSASTVIGADFMAPEKMRERGLPADTVVYLPTGERVADYERLAWLRANDPGGLCISDQFSGPEGEAALLRGLTLPGSVFASDAMPLTRIGDGWATHPRSTSTFTRALSWLHRDTGALSLSDAVARCTSGPAEILADCMPALEDRGHLGVGAVADLVAFDLAALEPSMSATPVLPAQGVRHTLVGGVAVVRDGATVPGGSPGQWLRTGSSSA